MKNLGFRSSRVNQYSCHAERELTLSEIDSMYQNRECNLREAREKALAIPNCDKIMIMAIFTSHDDKPEKVKMGPRWTK